MGVKLGAGNISKLYLGATEINKAYLGATLVYDAAPAPSYLLDTYTGAAAAYSLRQLKTGVTSVVRVRRSSDDVEADFTAAEITNGTLIAWTGANDGFVVTWYDQSGEGVDVTNATTSMQPLIVSSGSLILNNSKPTVSFVNHSLINNTFQNVYNYVSGTIISVTKSNISTRNSFLGLTLNSSQRYGLGIDLNLNIISRNQSEGNFGNTTINKTDTILTFAAGGTGYMNNLAPNITTGGDAHPSNMPLSLGRYVNTINSNCYIQEVVIYQTNRTADRAGIETNINAHYGIY